MKASGRSERSDQSDCIEYVPKRDLDQAQQEMERLRKEVDRLKQESERLRRELEAALRASKRQAGAAFAGQTQRQPKAAKPQAGPWLRPAGVPPHPLARG